jgi:hypothetical protein
MTVQGRGQIALSRKGYLRTPRLGNRQQCRVAESLSAGERSAIGERGDIS